MLPNLSLLKSTEGSLWQLLANPNTKNSKDPDCSKHGPQTETDDPENCAQEGYLMCRNNLPIVDGRSNAARDRMGQTVTVQTEDGPINVLALPPRTESTNNSRRKIFEAQNEFWNRVYFNGLCYQGYETVTDKDGNQTRVNVGVVYSKFKESLIEWTDWYYLDKETSPGRRATPEELAAYELAKSRGTVPRNRGLLFLRYFGTATEKAAEHMPHLGVFERPYLYVTLVCASGTKGYGEKLMNLAHSVAGALGIDTVVLATLPDPNTAGFYLMKMGYQFASRDGEFIDVRDWIVPHPTQAGKLLFDPEMDVNHETNRAGSERAVRKTTRRVIHGANRAKKQARTAGSAPLSCIN